MSTRKKRDIGGTVSIEGVALRWSVRSEPQWNTTAGDIGLRLSVVLQDETLTRHGEPKAWRELVLEYAFEKRQKSPSRFPERRRIDPETLKADIRLAMEAGWEPHSRGRPFVFQLFEDED